MPDQNEKLSDATHEADRKDAKAEHKSDRMPTSEEEKLAEKNKLDPEAAKNYEEMAERGAKQKGEGKI